jgi:hypothetical protein
MIQTDTTSIGKNSSIPMGQYTDVVKGQQEDDTTIDNKNKYIPRTIRIQPEICRKSKSDKSSHKHTQTRTPGTITTGNTSSGKTEKELELEAKNEKLEREVEELKKGLHTLQVQMLELVTAFKTERRTDTTPQCKKYKMTGTQKATMQENDIDMDKNGNSDSTSKQTEDPPMLNRPSPTIYKTRDEETVLMKGENTTTKSRRMQAQPMIINHSIWSRSVQINQ